MNQSLPVAMACDSDPGSFAQNPTVGLHSKVVDCYEMKDFVGREERVAEDSEERRIYLRRERNPKKGLGCSKMSR